MLDLAWSELAVIALVAVLVLGPKELPKAMRSVAQFMRKARKMAGEFQGHWNEMARETELDEVKKAVTRVTHANIGTEVEKLIDPTGEFGRELKDTVTATRTEIEAAAVLDPAASSQAAALPPPAPTSSAQAAQAPVQTAPQADEKVV